MSDLERARSNSSRKKGISPERIAFVMFKTTGGERENVVARQYLSEAGHMFLDGEASVSTAYGSTSDMGEAITEISFQNLNGRGTKLARASSTRWQSLRNGRWRDGFEYHQAETRESACCLTGSSLARSFRSIRRLR